jgi:hypothetical protein
MWCGSASSMFQRSLTSDQALVTFEVDVNPIAGLAWDGDALWVIDESGNLGRYDKTGQRLKRLAVSAHASTVKGMLWVEGELWVIDVFNDVNRFDSNFNIPGFFSLTPCGASFPSDLALFWDGEFLWVADAGTNRITQCKPED